MIKKLSFSFFFLYFTLNIYSQSNYSPYSMLGLGEIETRDYGRTAGMGNLSTGVRDFNYLNPSNPAAISGIDSLRLIFDISVSGKQSYYSRRSKSDGAFNGNLKKLSLGFRLAPRWGISVGVRPLSDVGYQIYSEEPIEGTNSTKAVYLKGSGGLYEFYISNGFKISNNFSVGINTMYISGIIKQAEDQTEYIFEKESRLSQIYNTFGIQYHQKDLTIGAIYGYKQSLSLTNKTLVYDSSYNLTEEEKDRSSSQFIPETMGVGFSLANKKLIWGMDFQYQKWEGLNSGTSNTKIVDSYRISGGLGYTPNSDKFYKIRNQGQIQVGGSLSQSYIQVAGKKAYNYSVTTGYSLPVDKTGTLLNLSLEYGNTLSAPSGYIKESYVMLTVNFSFIEQWFKRGKLY
ncbi:hypothetical protein [Dysgonomonas macrotermitis]|uniref:Long-chain fatty acid transport protein n=1 Tax=Dysgonomonas macrotermitis TaxID=1346286 RepID=A0A1M4WAW6_9BACT|nr:hypothetical protein [Dysgonomonas macrotermitis]SHE78366.1 hypothetical protein SAMN05444362_102178 [Dysgonomonas macrotermitis]